MNQIKNIIQLIQSNNIQQVKQAERDAESLSNNEEFIPMLLEEIKINKNINDQQIAAILIKTTIKKKWDVAIEAGGLSLQTRTLIKDNLLECMFVSSVRSIQLYLADSIQYIAITDFPSDWKNLLVTIIPRLKTEAHIYTCVKIMNSALSPYRSLNKSNETLKEVKFVLTQCGNCFYDILYFTQSKPITEESLEISYLVIKCIRALCNIDLAEQFEDHLEFYIGVMIKLLDLNIYDNLMAEKLYCEICKFYLLFVNFYQNEFDKYIARTIECIYSNTIKYSTYNNFIIKALNFLSGAVKTSWSQNPFSNQIFLSSIFNNCVVKNLTLNEEDIENITEQKINYISKELEGAEFESRRAAALNLLQSLSTQFTQKINDIVKDWISKNVINDEKLLDVAVNLIIGICVVGQSRYRVVTKVNDFIDINRFYNEYIKIRIMNNTNDDTIGKLAAIKYILTFRYQIALIEIQNLIPILYNLINSDEQLIYTFACVTLDRILSMRIDENGKPSQNVKHKYVIDKNPILILLKQFLNLLINKILKPNNQLEENEFIVKCILRILIFAKDTEVINEIVNLLPKLMQITTIISSNLSSATFAHSLFECISFSIKISGDPTVENVCLPIIVNILSDVKHEYAPYMFQLLGILLDYTNTNSTLYAQLFQSVLDKSCWCSVGNVPGMVTLISSYFKKFHIFHKIISDNLLIILERYQFCLFHKRLSSSAFNILLDLFEYAPLDVYMQYLDTIVKVLLTRLQQQNQNVIKIGVCNCISLLTVQCLINNNDKSIILKVLNNIQSNLSIEIMKNVYLPCIREIDDLHFRKIHIISVACLSESFINDPVLFNLCIDTIAYLIQPPNKSDNIREVRRIELITRDQNFQELLHDSENIDEYNTNFNKLNINNKKRLGNFINDYNKHLYNLLSTQSFLNICQNITNYKDIIIYLQGK